MNNRRSVLWLACSLAITGYPQVSNSQSEQLNLLEEVVVTAQRREQSANDVGMAITAIRGEAMDALGLIDTRDLPSVVPGFTVNASSTGLEIYTLRGVGFNTNNMSSTSPVGVYIDEFAYPYSIMAQGMNIDVERVEVLKGPQGTLYGRNTTGGLVNYITNKPTDEFEAYVKASYGRFETTTLEGMLSGSLSEDVSARFVVKSIQSQEGWQQSATRDDELGLQDKTAARLSVNWTPSDTTNLLLTASWWEDKSDAQAAQVVGVIPVIPGLEAPGLEDRVLVNPDNQDADWDSGAPYEWGGTTFTQPLQEPHFDRSMTSLVAKFDWDINESLTFTSLTGWGELERDDYIDLDGTDLPIIAGNTKGDIEIFSQELRLTGSTDTLEYTFGLYYAADETTDIANSTSIDNSSLVALRSPFPPDSEAAFGFAQYGDFLQNDRTARAVFGQVEWAASDSVVLTLGMRYNEDEMEYQGCSRDVGNGNLVATWNPLFGTSVGPGECITFDSSTFQPTISPFEAELEEDNLSGRVGVNWNLSDETLIYGAISRGFKSGNFPLFGAFDTDQLAPVTQEELLAYEIGIKTSLGATAQLNASVYHYDYKDRQVFGRIESIIFGSLTALVNAPESSVQGAEFDFTWSPTDSFFARVSASYVDTEYEEFESVDLFGNPVDLAGESFEYVPDFQFNAVASYAFSVSEQLDARITGDVRHSAEANGDPLGLPEFVIDDYAIYNAYLTLTPQDSAWELALWGRNLSDEYYFNSAQYIGADTVFRYANLPRTWGVSLQLNFD